MNKISETGNGEDKHDAHNRDIKAGARTGHIVLLGYGDVGKPVARTLRKIGVPLVIVDKYGEKGDKHDEASDSSAESDFVLGDCVEEDVLKSADIETASTIIVALNNDTNVIYSTLVSRTLNPDAIILARANSSKSIDKIYKAGADYVASLPIIAGQMLAKLTRSCTDLACDMYESESTMLYEGIQIDKYHIQKHSQVMGKTIKELDIRAKYGCTIIGIEADGYVNIDIEPELVLKEGMTIALIGSEKQVHKFKDDYGASP